MRRRSFAASTVVTALYWATMVYLLHAPITVKQPIPGWFNFPNIDKAIHIVLYGILAVLAATTAATRAWSKSTDAPLRPVLLKPLFVVLVVYAVVDETTQPLTGRFCDFFDGTFDVIGAGLGLTMFAKFGPRVIARLAND